MQILWEENSLSLYDRMLGDKGYVVKIIKVNMALSSQDVLGQGSVVTTVLQVTQTNVTVGSYFW